MSLHQSGSTTPNLIKQEEVEDVQPTGAPHFAHSPTSLLNLPDDILYLILEEVYEERYHSIAEEVSLEVVTILINKRIFSLAQPIWFRRLSINESQLDLRLSNLHLHDARRNALRRLSLAFAEPHLNLFKSVLLRLPHLTHLTLEVPDDIRPQTSAGLVAGLGCFNALQHLTLQTESRSRKHLTQLANDYIRAAHGGAWRLTLVRSGVLFHDVSYRRGTNLKSLAVQSTSTLFSREHWWRLFSLELHGDGEGMVWDDRFLEGFQDAIMHDDVSLERFKIAVHSPGGMRRRDDRIFEPRDYEQLLQLLQSTKIRHLELNYLKKIPDTPDNLQIGSLQLLRLSGSCSFKDSYSFRRLLALLSALPSLTQLHLIGDSFFGPTSSADEMSRHSEMSLLFEYPELGSLLAYLRRSAVTIFTYRGENEKREIRWTRLRKGEEFEKDCWTL